MPSLEAGLRIIGRKHPFRPRQVPGLDPQPAGHPVGPAVCGNHPLSVGSTPQASAEDPLGVGSGCALVQVMLMNLSRNFQKQQASSPLPDEEAKGGGTRLWSLWETGCGEGCRERVGRAGNGQPDTPSSLHRGAVSLSVPTAPSYRKGTAGIPSAHRLASQAPLWGPPLRGYFLGGRRRL